MSYESRVAARYIRGRRGGPLSAVVVIAAAGIALGVAALVGVLGITHGFERVFREKVLGVKAHAEVVKRGSDFVEYDEIAVAVRRVPGVTGATPYILRQGMIAAPGGIGWVSLKGVDPETVGQVLDLREYLVAGSMDALRAKQGADRGATPGCVLGVQLLKKLKAEVGNEIEFLLAGESWKGGSGAARHRSFRVVGVFQSGMYEFDSHLAILHIGELQSLAAEGGIASAIEIRLADPMAAEEVVPRIDEALKQFWDPTKFRDPLYISSAWQRMNGPLFRALAIQRLVLTIIMTCIIAVAASNIVCTLILIVLEKRREIAILMTMGATRGGVVRIFVAEGLGIGLLGTGLGLALGLGLLYAINTFGFELDPKVYFISNVPTEISLAEILFVAGASMVISLGATIYPALNAAALRPVEGLRTE